jgi:XTP/dITP diphosphohydrolase
MKKTILLASTNQGKTNEYQAMLKPHGYHVINLQDIGFTQEIPEDFDDYKDNAVYKLNEIAKVYQGTIIADDSGFEIAALNHQPGVHSARFLPELTYLEKNQHIIQQLKSHDDRSAAFVCALACWHDDKIWVSVNRCFGQIADEVMEGHGFGYDPIFIPLGYDQPFSRLDPAIKNSISHRALATKALIQYLEHIGD